MKNFSLIGFLLIGLAILSLSAFGQETSGSKPTQISVAKPTPRRSLDQFDLSNGIQFPTQPKSTAASSGPAVVEYLDEANFDAINRLISYSQSMEDEYKEGASQKVDGSYQYSPEKVLRKKLIATYRMLEIHSEGLLDNQPLQNEQNLNLLKANQEILDDMLSALTLMQGAQATYSGQTKSLADTYAVPFETRLNNEKVVGKQSLLNAMLTRLNKNFAVLKSQIAVAK